MSSQLCPLWRHLLLIIERYIIIHANCQRNLWKKCQIQVHGCLYCIYDLKLSSKVKFYKRIKENTFIKNRSDMQHGTARTVTYLINGQYQLTHLKFITSPAAKQYVKLFWKNLSAVSRLLKLPVYYQVVKTLAVHCRSDVISATGGHSAECRTSWVCLQHHTTVVTSNGVAVCGSKFPPNFSQHCQHQNSAIPTTTQAMWHANKPRSCVIQGADSSVQHHGSVLFIVKAISSLMCVHTCQHTTIKMLHKFIVYLV